MTILKNVARKLRFDNRPDVRSIEVKQWTDRGVSGWHVYLYKGADLRPVGHFATGSYSLADGLAWAFERNGLRGVWKLLDIYPNEVVDLAPWLPYQGFLKGLSSTVTWLALIGAGYFLGAVITEAVGALLS